LSNISPARPAILGRKDRLAGGLESRFERTPPRIRSRDPTDALRNPENRKEPLQEGYCNRQRDFSRWDVPPYP
jgi:hypothetical protein